MEKRIQKILAEMGIASRRKAEEMIMEGRVKVNGAIATIGQKADPLKDHIKLDGKLLTGGAEKKVYIAFNKPKNVMCTLSDPEGRLTVKDFMSGIIKERVFPVGRLDFDSEGLLLMTNDGDFANAVLHPSKKMPKVYRVKIDGVLNDDEIKKLETGVKLPDGLTAPAKVKKLQRLQSNSWLEITLTEGRKRQIRRMMQSIGHPVTRLVRIKIGPVDMGNLSQCRLRKLTAEEVQKIMRHHTKEAIDKS